MKISVLGGTGKLGFALVKRLSKAGYKVMIGSRNVEKARNKIKENSSFFSNEIFYGTLTDAAECGEVVFITVPYKSQEDTITSIKELVKNKIIVDATVPLNPQNLTTPLELEMSVADRSKQILGNSVRLVSGYHTISHVALNQIDSPLESDVLLCGDSEEAIKIVSDITSNIGGNPIYVGKLNAASTLERLTPLIIFMNKQYKSKKIGIKVTGIL